jgi:hypothetical protein
MNTKLFQWSKAVTPKKASVSISPEYVNFNNLEDDCLMALVFQYPDELCKKLYVIAAPSERSNLMNLFNQEEIHCELDSNANIIIKN